MSDNELAQLGGPLNEQNVQQVTLLLPNGTEYDKKGKLNFAASQIDPTLGTQQLRATFENTDQRLLPGQFVRARVITGERDGVFLVPQVAVQRSDLGNIVYIVNEKNEATIQPVVAGQWMGKEWVILEGLKAGDKVIVDNIIKLRPGMPVAPDMTSSRDTCGASCPGYSACRPFCSPRPLEAGLRGTHHDQILYYPAHFCIGIVHHHSFGRAGCRDAIAHRTVSTNRASHRTDNCNLSGSERRYPG